MDTDLETIWNQFNAKLRRFILKRVSNADAADDILQEVYIRIHSRIDTLRDDSKLQSWIYQIARNAIIGHYRRQKPTVEFPETLFAIQFVRPTFEHFTSDIHHQALPPSTQRDLDVVELVPPPHLERLPQQHDLAMPGHLANPDDAPFANGEMPHVETELGGQAVQPFAASVLRNRPVPQARLDMVLVDGRHQPGEFASQDRRIFEVPLEQQRLKPAIEVLHGAIALWATLRNEDRCDSQIQAQSNHPREIARELAPAAEPAGVVELHLGGQTEILPGLDQERQHLVHPPRTP